MLEDSLTELESWVAPSKANSASAVSATVPSQDDSAEQPDTVSEAFQDEVKELKKQLASLQRIQKVTFTQLSELREEKEYLLKKEKDRADRA